MAGFNLPPGCSVRDLPGYESFPCDVCGRYDDDCICPECFVCGAIGDMKCYRAGHLEFSQEQNESRQAAHEQAQLDAKADNAYWNDLYGDQEPV